MCVSRLLIELPRVFVVVRVHCLNCISLPWIPRSSRGRTFVRVYRFLFVCLCCKYHVIDKDVDQWFDIDCDKFGRTSTPQQTEIAQFIFLSLYEKKRLNKNTMIQPFYTTCNRVLSERLLEGTCPCPTPGCGYRDAQVDQCNVCGKLLNANELINPTCKGCNTYHKLIDNLKLFHELKGRIYKR